MMASDIYVWTPDCSDKIVVKYFAGVAAIQSLATANLPNVYG